MKKLFVIIVLALAFVLCSCGKSGDIDNKQSAEISSSQPESIELSIPVGDYFTIIEATYTTKLVVGEKVSVKLKMRNNTDLNFQEVSFQYYFYDKNGDRVGALVSSVPVMEAGHAAWSFDLGTGLTADEFGSLRIEYFNILESIDDNTMQSVEKVTLNPMPEVFFEQMTERDR